MKSSNSYKGQGAIQNLHNHFERNTYEKYYEDEWDEEANFTTQWIEVFPKTILNTVKSPDLRFELSMNPYQGCEHGCAYCYARPTHEYWGYSAGLDFERKIMVKTNAPQLLRKAFEKKNYTPKPIMLSGNTDCYQPIERKLEITRKLLEVCLEFKHPVSIITKNALVLRDLDILKPLAELNLVRVAISIPTFNESLRQRLEPRTSSVANKLKAMEVLSSHKIPVFAMIAPIIPGLNSEEIFVGLKKVAQAGAYDAGYTLVRLNDTVEPVFKEWIEAHFPDKAQKVLNLIRSMHGGKLGEKSMVKRNVGEGNIAEMIHTQFKVGKQKFFKEKQEFPPLDLSLFTGKQSDQLSLF